MASRFPAKSEMHFDSTCGTINDETGEIEGVQSVMYQPPKRNRGRVVVVGSRMPVGWTPGGFTPGEGRLMMYRKDALNYLLKKKNAYGPRSWGDIPMQFTVSYAPLDEETGLLIPQVDSFLALLDPPGDLSFDRTSENTPLMVEIGLFMIGPMFLNGVEMI